MLYIHSKHFFFWRITRPWGFFLIISPPSFFSVLKSWNLEHLHWFPQVLLPKFKNTSLDYCVCLCVTACIPEFFAEPHQGSMRNCWRRQMLLWTLLVSSSWCQAVPLSWPWGLPPCILLYAVAHFLSLCFCWLSTLPKNTSVGFGVPGQAQQFFLGLESSILLLSRERCYPTPVIRAGWHLKQGGGRGKHIKANKYYICVCARIKNLILNVAFTFYTCSFWMDDKKADDKNNKDGKKGCHGSGTLKILGFLFFCAATGR